MNETQTTVRGTIITHPVSRRVGDDPVFSFRVASNSRYFDRNSDEWRNGSTLYLAVSCWGKIAERVGGKLVMGDAVILQGRLLTNEYEKDGVPCRDTEMRVTGIGADMVRMDVSVRRPRKEEGAAAGAEGSGEGPEGDDDEAGTPTDVSGLREVRAGELVGAGTGPGSGEDSGAPF